MHSLESSPQPGVLQPPYSPPVHTTGHLDRINGCKGVPVPRVRSERERDAYVQPTASSPPIQSISHVGGNASTLGVHCTRHSPLYHFTHPVSHVPGPQVMVSFIHKITTTRVCLQSGHQSAMPEARHIVQCTSSLEHAEHHPRHHRQPPRHHHSPLAITTHYQYSSIRHTSRRPQRPPSLLLLMH